MMLAKGISAMYYNLPQDFIFSFLFLALSTALKGGHVVRWLTMTGGSPHS